MEDLQPLAAARTRSVSGLDRPIRRRGPQGDAMRRLRATHPIPSARSLLNSGGTRLGGWPARQEAAPHRASLSQRYFGREPMPAFDAAGLRCGRGVKRMVLPSQGRNCAVDCQPPPAASRWPRPCPASRREAFASKTVTLRAPPVRSLPRSFVKPGPWPAGAQAAQDGAASRAPEGPRASSAAAWISGAVRTVIALPHVVQTLGAGDAII
jgi:hypothetical protein